MILFDIGIIFILLICMIAGWKHGVIREAVSLVGIILVFIISYYAKGILGNIMCQYLPFIPLEGSLKEMTSLNIFFYQAIAFLIVFSILLGVYEILMKVSKWIQKIVNITIILWLPSKIAGAFIGLIKGWLLLFIILLVLNIPLKNLSYYEDSVLTKKILYETPVLRRITSPFMSGLEDVYGLVKEPKQKDKNQKAIDIMIKYNIVDENTIQTLKEKKKI